METEADDLSPLYEAFLFENNHALASRRWYGYHGRIENSACVMCTLYVRKWHLGQPSTFSQGCRVRAESKPDVKQFTAISLTKTIIEADVLTKGYCPLTYKIRGGQMVRSEMRQFIGTSWEIVVSQDTGAVINRVEKGYSVSVYYEIHNDPGCADRHIILTPTVNGHNMRTTESRRREVAFGKYTKVIFE
ncbi:unnamed protein product [Echinostoma caproni]|uniref:Agenet-like domain-containing protein n=1 Tax=Echinostoma caproni TaxID=27848 RepID=A0A183BDR6_9TREM|nr:unnamed protein product [Echinostoma caproni]